jgi:hypothetical protein
MTEIPLAMDLYRMHQDAIEARVKKVEENNQYFIDYYRKKLLARITKRASRGYTDLSVSLIPKKLEEELRAKGYVVSSSSSYEYSRTYISWKK